MAMKLKSIPFGTLMMTAEEVERRLAAQKVIVDESMVPGSHNAVSGAAIQAELEKIGRKIESVVSVDGRPNFTSSNSQLVETVDDRVASVFNNLVGNLQYAYYDSGRMYASKTSSGYGQEIIGRKGQFFKDFDSGDLYYCRVDRTYEKMPFVSTEKMDDIGSRLEAIEADIQSAVDIGKEILG